MALGGRGGGPAFPWQHLGLAGIVKKANPRSRTKVFAMPASSGVTSSSVNGQSDAYKHPESALEVDFRTPDKATRSLELINANSKLQGKKILFYKHGENYYAVPEEDRPAFWHRQFFKCFFTDEQLEYANTEVGERLADFFDESGKELRSKMKWGFWKQAVATEEFLPAVAQGLSDHAEQLHKTLGPKWDEAYPDWHQTRGAHPGNPVQLLAKAQELREAIGRGGLDLDWLESVRQEINGVQWAFWDRLAQDRNVSDQPAAGDDRRGPVAKRLKKMGVSGWGLNEIRTSGLDNPRTVDILDHWIGPPDDPPEGVRHRRARGLSGGQIDFVMALEEQTTKHRARVSEAQIKVLRAQTKVLRLELYRKGPWSGCVSLVADEIESLRVRLHNMKFPGKGVMSFTDQQRELDKIEGRCKALAQWVDSPNAPDNDSSLLNELVDTHLNKVRTPLQAKLRGIDSRVKQAESEPLEAPLYLSTKELRAAVSVESDRLAQALDSLDARGTDHSKVLAQLEQLNKDVQALATIVVTNQKRARLNHRMGEYLARAQQ